VYRLNYQIRRFFPTFSNEVHCAVYLVQLCGSHKICGVFVYSRQSVNRLYSKRTIYRSIVAALGSCKAQSGIILWCAYTSSIHVRTRGQVGLDTVMWLISVCIVLFVVRCCAVLSNHSWANNRTVSPALALAGWPSPWAAWPLSFSAELSSVGTHRQLAASIFDAVSATDRPTAIVSAVWLAACILSRVTVGSFLPPKPPRTYYHLETSASCS